MDQFNLIQQITLWALPVIFAITVHEVAHGWVAYRLGDPTAKMLGRLSLNPIKHIDPIGSIIVPLVLLWLGGFVFGWAKPVPIGWQNLRNPQRDIALVGAAGPAANLLMALIWTILLSIAYHIGIEHSNFANVLFYMARAGILINLILMVLNLLPIPPLDGSRVLLPYLKGKVAYYYARIEPYGLYILIILIVTGVLSKIILPIITAIAKFLFGLALPS